MPFPAICPACKQECRVPDNAIGKRVGCPACGKPIQVSAAVAAGPPPRPIPLTTPVVAKISNPIVILCIVAGGLAALVGLMTVVGFGAWYLASPRPEAIAVQVQPVQIQPAQEVPPAPKEEVEPKPEPEPVKPVEVKPEEKPAPPLVDLWTSKNTPAWVTNSKFQKAKIRLIIDSLEKALNSGEVVAYSRTVHEVAGKQFVSGSVAVDRSKWRSKNVIERRDFASSITSFLEMVVRDNMPRTSTPIISIVDSETREPLGKRSSGSLGILLP